MQLATPRLLLREVRPSDDLALREMDRDPQVLRFEHAPFSEEQSRSRLEQFIVDCPNPATSHNRFALTLRPDDQMLGWIALTLNNFAIREYEIGWTLHPRARGNGYATEAAHAVLRYAFDELHAHRVVAFCHAENQASIRVMERLGMRFEGRLRQVRWLHQAWWDECVYAILEQDFGAQSTHAPAPGER